MTSVEKPETTPQPTTLRPLRPITVDPSSADVVTVASRMLPSVVQIVVHGHGETASGSGFVLDARGHIITNNHVVAVAASSGDIKVVYRNGVRRDGSIVGRSPAYDVAVVHVDDPPARRPALLGDSGDVQVGETVVAIGSPLGLSDTVTSGIVSATDRPVTAGGQGEISYINAIQTDAAINPGNSGGPLVDLHGQVIGINSAIATVNPTAGEAGNIGVGFAIPIDQVRRTARQLIATGHAVYPIIGASVDVSGPGVGARVTDVQPGSPAASAGLHADDVITSVDGKPVSDGIELIVAIRAHLPGDTITVGFRRGSEHETTRVRLASKVG